MQSRPLIGVRHEDKSPFERRAPLAPSHVARLVAEHGIDVAIESSPTRVFRDDEYTAAGGRIVPSLDGCPIILGVKEVPAAKLAPQTAYVYFAHVIKGQPYNMGMLRTLLERSASLIDYEKVTDAEGRRLIFFGRYAGLAGMIDTLWALGQRLARRGLLTPLGAVKRAHQYADLDEVRAHLGRLGERLAREGIPAELQPLTVGFTGYGNVSQGAQEILELLPTVELSPAELAAGAFDRVDLARQLVKVVYREQHMVAPRDPHHTFELQDYYQHPERYRGTFAAHWPLLRVLVNCIYWDTPYPRLVTRDELRRRSRAGAVRLEVIGDISCDVEGAVEITLRPTTVDRPVFTYDPASDSIRDGLAGPGPVVMAIDNLPCELPADATRSFGDTLVHFVPALARASFAGGLEALALPPELRRALIVYRGALTDDYAYLERFVASRP